MDATVSTQEVKSRSVRMDMVTRRKLFRSIRSNDLESPKPPCLLVHRSGSEFQETIADISLAIYTCVYMTVASKFRNRTLASSSW
jgi:hypothetical protein